MVSPLPFTQPVDFCDEFVEPLLWRARRIL